VGLNTPDHNDAGHTEPAYGRTLGRGLEEVSHLFLSHKSGDASNSAGTPVRSSESAPPPPATRGGVALLRPVQLTRDRLAAILVERDGVLEEGLRTIDAKIPCHPCGEIDLLAVDRTNKLMIIDFETSATDGLLVRGLGHFDWLLRNMANAQRMYPAQGADFSLPPRLLLLAPQFSPLLRRAAQQITRPQIYWARYHTVETPGGPEIAIEPIVGE
jgi:hypothetical protein